MKNIVFLLGLTVVIIIGFAACGEAAAASPAPDLLIPVSARIDTAVVTRGTVAEAARHVGIVRVQSEGLHFGVAAGNFGAFYVRTGEQVTQGQLLARLDTEAIYQQIQQQEERISRLQQNHIHDTALRNVEIDILTLEHMAMQRETQAQRDAAQQRYMDIGRARMELDLAVQRHAFTMRHENAYLQTLEERRRGTAIYAPFDGTITYLATRTWVPSFSPVVFISPEDAPVFIEYIGTETLTPGRAARITGHMYNQIMTLTHAPFTREQVVHYRSMGGMMPVRFAMDTETPPAVGTLVPLYIYSVWQADSLRIPGNALFFSPDTGFYVHRVENGMLLQTIISTGVMTDTFVSVTSGLTEGDVVYVRP